MIKSVRSDTMVKIVRREIDYSINDFQMVVEKKLVSLSLPLY